MCLHLWTHERVGLEHAFDSPHAKGTVLVTKRPTPTENATHIFVVDVARPSDLLTFHL
jgi:hypothetical protein